MRSVWFSPRSVGLHVIVVVLTPVFILLFLWQVRRATSGNTLSWAYVFEWPFFLGYLLYMWWRLVHEAATVGPGAAGTAGESATADATAPDAAPGARGGARRPDTGRAQGTASPARAPQATDHDDEELAAYNRYLAELNASGRSKHW